jgi:hypothetical protein
MKKHRGMRAENVEHGEALDGTPCGAARGSTMQYQLELETQ